MIELEFPNSTKQRDSIQTLLGLVNHFSPTGNEEAAVKWLVQRMNTIGYTKSYVDDVGNAIGIMGQGTRQIILLGHIDTVKGEIPVEISGDILYGRGTADAKASLAVFVEAVRNIGVKKGWEIIVIGAIDEEGDSKGARSLVSKYSPEFAVGGEPNNWDRIAIGYKGISKVTISTMKSLTHTARASPSTCETAIQLWNVILGFTNEYNLTQAKAFNQLQPSLLKWDSGDDGFTEWANLYISTRIPPNFSPEQWVQTLVDLLPNAKIKPIGYAVKAFVSDKNNLLVRSFLHGIRNQNGTPKFVFKTGTSDINTVAPYWKCPAIVYGPGDSALDHTPEEAVSVSEYLKSIQVFEDSINYLCDNS